MRVYLSAVSLLVVGVLAGAGMTACGESSGTTHTDTRNANIATDDTARSAGQQSSTQAESAKTKQAQPLARAELIARADAVCRRLNGQAASIIVRSPQDVGLTAPALAGYYRAALVKLRELTPPATLASDWRTILADIQPIPDEIRKMGEYATDNEFTSVGAVEHKISGLQSQRFTIAKRDGFTDCAKVAADTTAAPASTRPASPTQSNNLHASKSRIVPRGRQTIPSAQSMPFKKALAQFAECLRQNGVDIPPPNTSGRGPVFNTKSLNTSSPQYRATLQRCHGVLEIAFHQAARAGTANSG